MIVPNHWAEARKQHRAAGQRITVRRYGWSATSAAEALANAEARADEALRRAVAGEPIARREPKVAYNGAAGVPIREEVLSRHGEQVITRNGYGAHCLNSPNALFADVDFNPNLPLQPVFRVLGALALVAAVLGGAAQSWGVGFGLLLAALCLAWPLGRWMARRRVAAQGGPEGAARAAVVAFVAQHPGWNVRVYRTPAGCRLLATHQAFEARSAEVQAFFAAVSADPVYVRMCVNQQCFRARLTAKPWRICMASAMRPRPGVWPVKPEHLEGRQAWLAVYEAKAAAFAACQYTESIGSGRVDPAIQPVVELHDQQSGALASGRPLG